MERLTYWSGGYDCWSYHGPSGDAAKRLAAYEETGVEPEEIEKIRKDVEDGFMKSTARRYGVPIARLRELAQAESKAHPPESRVPGDAHQNGQGCGRDPGRVCGTARGEKSDAGKSQVALAEPERPQADQVENREAGRARWKGWEDATTGPQEGANDD